MFRGERGGDSTVFRGAASKMSLWFKVLMGIVKRESRHSTHYHLDEQREVLTCFSIKLMGNDSFSNPFSTAWHSVTTVLFTELSTIMLLDTLKEEYK